jgi:hypothetical protein
MPPWIAVLTFESPSASSPEPCSVLFGDTVYLVGSGNLHFAVVGKCLTNFARTTLIRYGFLLDCDVITIDSTIEELGPGCCTTGAMKTLTFAEPSRLRIIGWQAFGFLQRLVSVVIPRTVEVIECEAFFGCSRLEHVQIERGSRLRLIEEEAFACDRALQPVDVPSAAKIEGHFKVLARIRDEDGSQRRRVKFPSDGPS